MSLFKLTGYWINVLTWFQQSLWLISKLGFISPPVRHSETGYNTHIPMYYYKNKTTHRELIKAYGILFKIETEAKARKVDIINLLLNTGSGLGLLGLSSVICEAVLTYVHRYREYYKQHTTQILPKCPPQKSMVRVTGQRYVYVIENSDSRSSSEC